MSADRTVVFLTGATGFLGHYVLADLLANPNVCCRVLLRPPIQDSTTRLRKLLGELGLNLSALIADGRVVVVEGALPESLGVDDIRGADLVLHAAGNTVFHTNGSSEPARTNVNGTRELLSLAAEAGVGRFVYVSTAYVCGAMAGHLPEAFYPTVPPVRNDYERSKWEAETLVWDWAKQFGVATICRPSILFGDGESGRASAMQGLYVVARATEILARAMDSSESADRRQIPLRILGRADATCNVIPVNWAAEHIVRLALHSSGASSVHHITNSDPPTHQEVKGWLEEYFDIGGGRFSDASWPLQDANHYEDLFYSLGNVCLDYFRNGLTFDSECTTGLPAGMRLIDGASFARCLKYAQETNWGRASGERTDFRSRRGGFDPAWYFEEFLPDAVPRSAVAKVEDLTAVVQYTIKGAPGGSWVSRFRNGQLEETHAVPCNLQAEFEYLLSYEDLVDVVACCRPLQDVFFHGSAEMTGDVERALKMVPIIGEFIKEFPVVGEKDSALAC